MKEAYNIRFEPRILKQLGDELVENGYDAITELVRNAYDSGASWCNIILLDKLVFDNDISEALGDYNVPIDREALLIMDNGKGMTKSEMIEGFLTVGTTLKLKEKKDLNESDRVPVGEKGIGRFSCQKLGHILVLESESENQERNIAFFDWNSIISSENKIHEIPIEITSLQATGKSYTKLWICDLVNSFDYYAHIEKEQAQLTFIQEKQKFELVKELEASLSHIVFTFKGMDENFKISVEYNNETILIKSKDKFLSYAESIYTFDLSINNENKLVLKAKMEVNPWMLENIYNLLQGRYNAEKYKKPHEFFESCLTKIQNKLDKNLSVEYDEELICNKIYTGNINALKEIKNILPIFSKVYYYRRRGDLLAMAIESAKVNNREKMNGKDNIKVNVVDLRDFLENHNGVKLFRNKTRVGRIGAKDDDWLQLQQLRTKGQQFFRFEYGNLVGFIQVNDPKQEHIRDVSSRTKLLENDSSKSLIELSRFVFSKLYYDFNKYANHIIKEFFRDSGLILRTSIEDVSKNSDNIIESVTNLKKRFSDVNIIGIKNDFDIINIQNQLKSIEEEFTNVIKSADESKRLTQELIYEQKRIEAEAYNNFKLMANGLITETITHELHSILSNNEKLDFKSELDIVRDSLYKHNELKLLDTNFASLEAGVFSLYSTVENMNGLYLFLEKTFILNDEKIEFEEDNLTEFIRGLKLRLENRLHKNNVELINKAYGHWNLPKGSLVHVFYNLIDNSLYWIKENRKRNRKLNINNSESDIICIESVNSNTIRYYDSGLGVIHKMEDVLFGPLVSGKEKDGRGMGMYIVKQLLNSVNADIYLLNERNEWGNRYIFEICINK